MLALPLFVSLASSGAFAQAAKDTPDSKASQPAQGKDGEVVQLNPFQVESSNDNGYSTLNSNSVTRFNTELRKLPVSADIFDSQFMSDIGAQTVEDMIQGYSAGAGVSSASPDASAAQSQPGDRSGAYITLRGLFSPQQQRDGFMPNAAADSSYTRVFDVDRVEVIKGPQALLYGGSGGAGGVSNIVSKRAVFDQAARTTLKYYVDQYGTKFGDLDYSMGTDNFAIRLAVSDGVQKYRRVNLGGPVNGQYLELSFKFLNTTVIINGELQYYNRILSSVPSLTSTGSAGAATDRNSDNLQYLLATHQEGAVNPVTGAAYASGAIDNGLLNWGNVDSYGTWLNSVTTSTRYTTAEFDSKWNSWLQTQLHVGYTDQGSDKLSNGLSFNAPTAGGATDPYNNLWNIGFTPGDTDGSSRVKAVRFSALASNEFFQGKVHSQTILGADYTRTDSALVAYNYYQADQDFNVIVNPSLTSNQGRTILPKIFFPIASGPMTYAYFMPRAQRVTIDGVNYVRQITNPVIPGNISDSNPIGVAQLGGSNYSLGHLYNRGIYGVNSASFLNDRLTTIIGFRNGFSEQRTQNQGFAPPTLPTTTKLSVGKTTSFSAGVNYQLLSWLYPYAEFSDSFDPPLTQAQDPYGNNPPIAHGIGEEAGFKVQNSSNTLSASLAVYHVSSKNEQYLITSTLMNDINPTGLNGAFGPKNQWVPTNRDSKGLELIATANPTPNWRLRFSGSFTNGTIQSTTTYNQIYNDQFYQNSAGTVTYANGTPVYVLGTATSTSTAKEVTPTAAGAVPLTLVLMNSSTSPYYANPTSITGQINSGSVPGKIFTTPLFASSQGSILTGVTGLPISQAQINTASNPNNAGYIAPLGAIAVTQAGDSTTGYPEFAANVTSVYQFSEGLLKGFRIGGTVAASWKLRQYYYYPTGFALGADRELYSFPTSVQLNGIFGYTRKFRRIVWSSQLNVSNLLNHYDIIVTPNAINGFKNLQNLNATWNAQPRMYAWTNTFSF